VEDPGTSSRNGLRRDHLGEHWQGAVALHRSDGAAFGAIASGGRMVRPHVTNPTDLPPGIVPAQSVQDAVAVPIDPKNWEIITDAMAQW